MLEFIFYQISCYSHQSCVLNSLSSLTSIRLYIVEILSTSRSTIMTLGIVSPRSHRILPTGAKLLAAHNCQSMGLTLNCLNFVFRSFLRCNPRCSPIVYRLIGAALIGIFFHYPFLNSNSNFSHTYT